MHRKLSTALGVLALLAGPGTVLSSTASAATTEPAATVPLPPAFEVPATNGYRAIAMVLGRPQGPQKLWLRVGNRNGGVSYFFPVDYTESSIEADLGKLGEIVLHAVPSGHPKTENSRCGGGGTPYTIETGHWEGTIRFGGEEGFASIDATRAAANTTLLTSLVCGSSGFSEGVGGHSPGALLTVERHTGSERLELDVRKNKRVGPTRIQAEVSERRGGVLIDRGIGSVDSNRAFSFEIPPGVATTEPPMPFSGSLEFTRGPDGAPKVTGNLRIDFPGRANVPALGPGKVRASLERAVLNPGHPF